MQTGTLTGTPLASKTGALPRSCYLSSWGWSPASVGGRPLDDSTCNMHRQASDLTQALGKNWQSLPERTVASSPFLAQPGTGDTATPRIGRGWRGVAVQHPTVGLEIVGSICEDLRGSSQLLLIPQEPAGARPHLPAVSLGSYLWLLPVAPREGIEPSSLVLIQSQAGPASRPTGERSARAGLRQG